MFFSYFGLKYTLEIITYHSKLAQAGLVTIAILAGCLNPSAQNQSDKIEWRHYNGDVSGTKFSPLEQINSSNVKDLALVWRYRVDDFVEGLSLIHI